MSDCGTSPRTSGKSPDARTVSERVDSEHDRDPINHQGFTGRRGAGAGVQRCPLRRRRHEEKLCGGRTGGRPRREGRRADAPGRHGGVGLRRVQIGGHQPHARQDGPPSCGGARAQGGRALDVGDRSGEASRARDRRAGGRARHGGAGSAGGVLAWRSDRRRRRHGGARPGSHGAAVRPPVTLRCRLREAHCPRE